MNITRQAALIAAYAHRSQTYGDMTYYDGHLDVVANYVARITESWKPVDQETATAVAYLHDSLEDKVIKRATLARDLAMVAPFHHAEFICQIVYRLARMKNESYTDYIRRLCAAEAPLLRKTLLTVKSADLLANIAAGPNESLLKRYHKALGAVATHLGDERKPINDILIENQITS